MEQDTDQKQKSRGEEEKSQIKEKDKMLDTCQGKELKK